MNVTRYNSEAFAGWSNKRRRNDGRLGWTSTLLSHSFDDYTFAAASIPDEVQNGIRAIETIRALARHTLAMTDTIQITINGEAQSVQAGLTVAALLAHLKLNPTLRSHDTTHSG